MSEARYAFLVANDAFPSEPRLHALRTPLHAVRGLADVLHSSTPPFAEVSVVENAASHEVLQKFNRLLNRIGRDDLVLFFYSGHGKPNGDGQLHLATSDTQIEALESTAVPTERIGRLLKSRSVGRAVVILDCCFSGAAGQDLTMGDLDSDLQQFVRGGSGRYLIAASTEIEVGLEKAGETYSVFTKHLIDGWKGKADPEHGRITVGNLYRYVHDQVVRESSQTPTKHEYDIKGELVLTQVEKSINQERREAAIAVLDQHRAQGWIDLEVYGAAVQLLAKPSSEQTELELRREALVIELAEGRLKVGAFNKAWFKLDVRPPETPPPEPVFPRPLPVALEPERVIAPIHRDDPERVSIGAKPTWKTGLLRATCIVASGIALPVGIGLLGMGAGAAALGLAFTTAACLVFVWRERLHAGAAAFWTYFVSAVGFAFYAAVLFTAAMGESDTAAFTLTIALCEAVVVVAFVLTWKSRRRHRAKPPA